MGASGVRNLFARAMKEEPSIIFIDEEMDGFDNSSAVIVLGAINHADVLDPTVLRPRRFDQVVMVSFATEVADSQFRLASCVTLPTADPRKHMTKVVFSRFRRVYK
ncbi:hypothetical protein RYX36_034272 [Vicia faba]